MTNGLNWKEQMQWELYKQYLGCNDANVIHVAYDLFNKYLESFPRDSLASRTK